MKQDRYIQIAFNMICIATVLIVAGCVSACVISLKSDREGISLRMNKVNDNYDNLKIQLDSFNSTRSQIYATVFNNSYETLYQKDNEIKNTLSNYENMIDEINKNVIKLNKLCTDTYYPETSINKKCNNYKVEYEKANNLFVKDVNLYNENINIYNQYQVTNQTGLSINKYETYKEYIDYNKDGKVEENEV